MKTAKQILNKKTEHQYEMECIGGAKLFTGIDYDEALEAMEEFANQFKRLKNKEQLFNEFKTFIFDANGAKIECLTESRFYNAIEQGELQE